MKQKISISVISIVSIGLITISLTVLYYLGNPEKETLDENARANTSGKYILLSQGITHYEMEGADSAETVVLVHGFSVPYYIWDSTYYALIKSGYRVLRYDTYGRGFSDRLDIDYTEEVYDRQLIDLLKALKLKAPVNLIGLSFGGPVTSYFSAHHQEFVKSLTLVDTGVRAMVPPSLPEWCELYFIKAFKASELSNQSTDFYQPEKFPGWNDKYKVQMKYKGFIHSLISTRYHYKANPVDQFKKIAESKIPTLLIWGKEDPTIPFSESTVVIETLHPIFLPVERVGHLPHMEAPAVVMPTLLDFLSKNR